MTVQRPKFDAGRDVVKDREDRSEKLEQASKLTYVNLASYTIIMLAEIIIGHINEISVLVADGLNNLTGVFGAAILIFGLRVSRKPPDANHLQGHWQFENIASLMSATIMFAVSLQIFYEGFESVKRFLAGNFAHPNTWSLVISLCAALMNGTLSVINSRHGKKLKNQALITAGQDLKSDSWTSSGTFLSIAGAFLGLHWIDGVATLIVGFIILRASITIFRTTILRLTEGFNPKYIAQYRKTIESVPGVLGVANIEPRYLSDQVVIAAGIYVAGETPVTRAYQIGERVEKALMQKYDILDADVKAYPVKLKKQPTVTD